ncbi:MAG TPA: cob(I)yrinic acid a,c-diamide adenosyltransferase [Solirubrobacterales bacterium]|jgi:cob(I)alamin adenosyltransferase|nr:cob(I)yrinic acid a,c-diamide adenosyltransferase [Solirubrobacterales bacterium]
MDENKDRWGVGELAAAAGVTVRTLHHYDRLGLLEPVERSGAGYRHYDRDGVERLYRILALRDLGFPLAEIGELLDADAGSLREATRARLEQTEAELARGEELRQRLRDVLGASEPTPAELIETMEAMTMGVKLTRIYTRAGDGGHTGRAGGGRVPKDDPVVEAGGEVDELGAALGLTLAMPGVPAEGAEWLRRIQNDLFDLGAELSVPAAARRDGRGVDAGRIAWLEELCDRLNAELEPLDSFLLPGGGAPYPAQLQVCRAVCRRAERRLVATEEAGPVALAYLNRLSDLLFIMARAAGSGEEALWEPSGRGAG